MVAASGWKNALTEATLTIAPEPCLTISVRAARLARSAMKKFSSIAQAKSSSLVPKKPPLRIRTAPTLLTSTSTRPCSSVARPISCAGPSGADRSIATGVTPLRPSRFSVVREPATTWAPSSARVLVTARPMPLPAPVTTATLPARLRSIGSGRLGRAEAPDEGERGLRHVLPAVVDGQRVSAALDLGYLGHVRIVLLLLERGVGDGPRDGVVAAAADEQHRSAARVRGVDLRLGPRVEVLGRGLEQRQPGGRHREGLVQPPGLVLADRVGEGVAKRLVGEGHGRVSVRWVVQRGRGDPERGERKRQHAAERRRVDRHRHRGQAAPGQDLREQTAEGVADDGRPPGPPADDRGHVV